MFESDTNTAVARSSMYPSVPAVCSRGRSTSASSASPKLLSAGSIFVLGMAELIGEWSVSGSHSLQ